MPAAQKSVPIVLIVLGVLALLAVLAVAGGVRAFHAAQQDSREASIVGSSFADNTGQHKHKYARAPVTPPTQAETTADILGDAETLTEKHQGRSSATGSRGGTSRTGTGGPVSG